jgi:hypothetical protein
MKQNVNKAWASMSADYVKRVCKAFRSRLLHVIEVEGGYID